MEVQLGDLFQWVNTVENQQMVASIIQHPILTAKTIDFVVTGEVVELFCLIYHYDLPTIQETLVNELQRCFRENFNGFLPVSDSKISYHKKYSYASENINLIKKVLVMFQDPLLLDQFAELIKKTMILLSPSQLDSAICYEEVQRGIPTELAFHYGHGNLFETSLVLGQMMFQENRTFSKKESFLTYLVPGMFLEYLSFLQYYRFCSRTDCNDQFILILLNKLNELQTESSNTDCRYQFSKMIATDLLLQLMYLFKKQKVKTLKQMGKVLLGEQSIFETCQNLELEIGIKTLKKELRKNRR